MWVLYEKLDYGTSQRYVYFKRKRAAQSYSLMRNLATGRITRNGQARRRTGQLAAPPEIKRFLYLCQRELAVGL
jgi:hypothetical protein